MPTDDEARPVTQPVEPQAIDETKMKVGEFYQLKCTDEPPPNYNTVLRRFLRPGGPRVIGRPFMRR
jgi:hypothetical protein